MTTEADMQITVEPQEVYSAGYVLGVDYIMWNNILILSLSCIIDVMCVGQCLVVDYIDSETTFFIFLEQNSHACEDSQVYLLLIPMTIESFSCVYIL